MALGAGVDRKTARRYIEAAEALGLDRDGGESQLADELIGSVCEAVSPSRPHGHGASWELLATHEDDIKAWVEKDLTVAKIGDLLVRRGVCVPERTLQRFCAERCGAGQQTTTVRVADGEPGDSRSPPVRVPGPRPCVSQDPATARRRPTGARSPTIPARLSPESGPLPHPADCLPCPLHDRPDEHANRSLRSERSSACRADQRIPVSQEMAARVVPLALTVTLTGEQRGRMFGVTATSV